MKHRSIPVFVAAVAALLLSVGAASAEKVDPAPKPATQPTTSQSKPSSPSKSASQAKKPKPIDINTAPAEELKKVPGIGDSEAEQIIRNRPYPTRAYLVTKGVLSQDAYYAVKDHFVATPPAQPKQKK